MILIERFYTPMGTFGHLFAPSFSCVTVERPWLGNKPFVSCIPEGKYKVSKGFFYKGGYETWVVDKVQGRTDIKFHVGNTPRAVQGCVALGHAFYGFGSDWGVRDSKDAFEDFMDSLGALGVDHSDLVIRCAPLGPAFSSASSITSHEPHQFYPRAVGGSQAASVPGHRR